MKKRKKERKKNNPELSETSHLPKVTGSESHETQG